MPLPFSGPAVPLAPADIDAAARRIGCPRAAVAAVCTVETGGAGGFLSDGSGRPRILCEARKFGEATNHRYDASNPTVSCRVNNWKLYAGGAAEYGRLAEMAALDRSAALESTSWGLFQVMGWNWEMLGYHDVEAFVVGMSASEAAQLAAFVTFCERNCLVQALRDLDWARFARGYNGVAYAANRYDTKLAAAYALAQGCPPPDGLLHIGCKGAAVQVIQRALVAQGYPLATDGIFGRVTENAVRTFQSMNGLTADGVVGPRTRTALCGDGA